MTDFQGKGGKKDTKSVTGLVDKKETIQSFFSLPAWTLAGSKLIWKSSKGRRTGQQKWEGSPLARLCLDEASCQPGNSQLSRGVSPIPPPCPQIRTVVPHQGSLFCIQTHKRLASQSLSYFTSAPRFPHPSDLHRELWIKTNTLAFIHVWTCVAQPSLPVS